MKVCFAPGHRQSGLPLRISNIAISSPGALPIDTSPASIYSPMLMEQPADTGRSMN
jgi:hypothetical protein